MTNNNSDAGPAPATQVEFAQYHLPPLKTGDYVMTLSQEVTIHGKDHPAFATTRRFRVQGPRCVLDPADIQAVFPPEGSLGDHSAALPHVIFNRSSLPWERAADPQHLELPWLALLLFDDAEKPAPELRTLADLRPATTASPLWPGLPAEVGEDEATSVTVIDVPQAYLQVCLPGEDDLAYLAHVRRGTDGAGRLVGDEVAVLMGNRVPVQGAATTVHLVSLENRYADGTFGYFFSLDPVLAGELDKQQVSGTLTEQFQRRNVSLTPQAHVTVTQAQRSWMLSDGKTQYAIRKDSQALNVYQEAAAGDKVRLISLKSWSFACVDANQSFFQLLWNLDPYTQGQRTKGSATLQVPATGVDEVDQYLAMGFVPLSHTLREGSRTVSWYHGPLIPWENTGTIDLPARAADQLTRFYPKLGMFDVSYAAAWELGRLLTLQSKQVATSLYTWKRRNAQQLHQTEQQVLHLPFAPKSQNGIEYLFSLAPHFGGELDYQQVTDDLRAQFVAEQYPLGPSAQIRVDQASSRWTIIDGNSSYAIREEDQALNVYGTASDLEKTVNAWFDNLNWLRGVPFNYLVPDERMLPVESIRFFWLDPVWIDCLLDGAFSIGRVTTADHALDQSFADRPGQAGYQITGFLLRSDVVSGWPGLLVDGYDADNNHLDSGRMERLSPNVLICLFRGVVSRVVLSQKPETLHFGLDGAAPGFFKKLRDPAEHYQESETKIIKSDEVLWRLEDQRTLKIAALANLIKSRLSVDPFTAAQFALQMTEATTGVEFQQ
jgi:hypothetical protein